MSARCAPLPSRHCLIPAVAWLLACAGCKPESARDSTDPQQAEMPPIAQRAPGAKAPEGQLGRVAGFFSDSRDPFQKMQAQYLQLLTARETGTSIQFEDALDRTEAQIAQLTELAANPPRYLFSSPWIPRPLDPRSRLCVMRERGSLGWTIVWPI